jgi:hypothetical protein
LETGAGAEDDDRVRVGGGDEQADEAVGVRPEDRVVEHVVVAGHEGAGAVVDGERRVERAAQPRRAGEDCK